MNTLFGSLLPPRGCSYGLIRESVVIVFVPPLSLCKPCVVLV